ncbi:MAG: hypothetical protein M3O26_08975 [Pseudomonadota bacterium]|nr:hypothetical protein [Pseudomonadota bacterium]
MKSIACFWVLSAVFTIAWADEPQPPAAQLAEKAAPVPAVTEVKSAPAESPALQSAAQSAPVDKASETAVSDAQIKQMRARGYKPVMRNGTLVFCRSEGQIGTHFEQTRCSTIDALNRAELTGKEYVDSLQKKGSPTPFKGP